VRGPEETTWGLDVSTNPRKTAGVALDWSQGAAIVTAVHHPLSAHGIVDLITSNGACQWAVDVPFGWPDRFVALLVDRRDGPLAADLVPDSKAWETWRTADVARRRTDQFLYRHPAIRTRPLPASFDRLGATAAMWSLIEARLAQGGVTVDRSGVTGLVCETYPRAAQAAWGHRDFAKPDLDDLRRMLPFLRVPDRLADRLSTDDARDAVVCAVVARARSRGLTLGPPDEDLAAARREGWIHVSVDSIGLLG